MAWVKVVKKFRDKNTKKVYEVGDKINLSKQRIDEILEVDKFIETETETKKEHAEEISE